MKEIMDKIKKTEYEAAQLLKTVKEECEHKLALAKEDAEQKADQIISEAKSLNEKAKHDSESMADSFIKEAENKAMAEASEITLRANANRDSAISAVLKKLAE